MPLALVGLAPPAFTAPCRIRPTNLTLEGKRMPADLFGNRQDAGGSLAMLPTLSSILQICPGAALVCLTRQA